MNYDDWKTESPSELRNPTRDEYEEAVDIAINDDNDLALLIASDPILRARYIMLRHDMIETHAIDLVEEAEEARKDGTYVDDEGGEA